MPYNVSGHCYTVNITKGKLMECTLCEYFEGSLLVMMMLEQMPMAVCVQCEAKMITPHYIVAEADTRN